MRHQYLDMLRDRVTALTTRRFRDPRNHLRERSRLHTRKRWEVGGLGLSHLCAHQSCTSRKVSRRIVVAFLIMDDTIKKRLLEILQGADLSNVTGKSPLPWGR